MNSFDTLKKIPTLSSEEDLIVIYTLETLGVPFEIIDGHSWITPRTGLVRVEDGSTVIGEVNTNLRIHRESVDAQIRANHPEWFS